MRIGIFMADRCIAPVWEIFALEQNNLQNRATKIYLCCCWVSCLCSQL